MVAAIYTETDNAMRWLGYLILSVLVNIVILSAIDLSKRADPLALPQEFRISFNSLAKSSQKAEPVAAAQPVQPEAVRPAPRPELSPAAHPAPVSVTPVVTRKDAQKSILQVVKTPLPVQPPVQPPVQQIEKPVETVRLDPRPAPLPRPKPRLKVAETLESSTVSEQLSERLSESVQRPSPVVVAAVPPVEKPAPQAREDLRGDDGKGPSSVVGKATYKNRFAPRYPRRAQDMGQQGTVKLHVLVARDGKAKELKIAQSSGYKLLDKAALAAVRKWEFVPKHDEGVTVASWVAVPVNFKMR